MKKIICSILYCVMLLGMGISIKENTNCCQAETKWTLVYYISINNEDKEYMLTAEQYESVINMGFSNMEVKEQWEPYLVSLWSSQGVTRIDSVDMVRGESVEVPGKYAYLEELGFEVSDDGILEKYTGDAVNVTIPSEVTGIGCLAFYNNAKVKAIYVPNSVKSVESTAFLSCKSLVYIVFSKETKTIEPGAVSNCSKFKNIVAPKNSAAYRYAKSSGILVVANEKIAFAHKKVYALKGDTDTNHLLNCTEKITWKSNNKKVVTVTATGKWKAKKKGRTRVTATVNGKKYSYAIVVMKSTIKNRVKQVKKQIIKKNMTDYDKVRTVHDWMIKNVKYDYSNYLKGKVPFVDHFAEGSLLNKKAVCDGYANGFRVLMDGLKIKCKVVVGSAEGGGHAWNMVKLDGKWYHVDVTFDDPIINGSNKNTKPYYGYFLKSSKTMKKDHKWMVKNYPKCTSRKYE